MVLDGFEEKHKANRSDFYAGPGEPPQRHGGGGSRMLFGDIPGHEMWGNDGLVTLQSARWGQFLGVMEECDHWALRGATGKESGVELGTSVSEPSEDRATAPNREVPGGGAGEDGWALGDWARFVRAWKREEKKAKAEEESIAAAAMAGVSDR